MKGDIEQSKEKDDIRAKLLDRDPERKKEKAESSISHDRKSYGSISGLILSGYTRMLSRHYIEYAREDHTEVNFGWKLHISLEEKEQNVTKAWQDVIIPIVRQYNLISFKCKREDQLGIELDGKTITLYLVHNPELGERSCCRALPIHEMIRALNKGLQEQRISTGVTPVGDRMITGSNYIYYRNEGQDKGDLIDGRLIYHYVATERAKEVATTNGTPEYNPYGYEDSFNLSGLDFSPPTSRCLIL